MKKSEWQEILDSVPDDYDIQFDAEINGKEITGLQYDQHDVNEHAKVLYITLYK